MRGKRTIIGKKMKAGPLAEMPTSLFLKKEMVAAAEKAVVYDLVEEFRGARKNRGKRIYISLAIITAVLLGGTFGLTRFIERNNRNIAIDISDFEDINMQELLYSLRNAGKLLADMRHSMDLLKGKMDLDMQRLRLKALQDIELLKKQHDLTEAQRAVMAKKILDDRDRKLAAINSEYDGKLKDRERAIEDAKKKIEEDNVRLKRTMDGYVQNLSVKLSQNQAESKADRARAAELVKQMGENYAVKRGEEKSDYEKKLRDISVKLKNAEDAAKASSGSAEEVKAMNKVYRRALVYYAVMRGEQGHVIHAEKNGDLLVVLNPLAGVDKSARGLVVNRKGAVIAKIEITGKDSIARARVIKRLSNEKINPFDMIVVEKE